VAGLIGWWYPVLLVPLFAVRAGQMRAGLVRGDPLGARKIGIHAHRLGVVLLLAANLIAAR
jgi:1,4-dihydroxy-2-naphthoate octaprenyltransferase